MVSSLSVKTVNQEKQIWLFLLGWSLLNAAQAYTLGLHSDEAYYWVYSRLPAWGYYDHPPMVAVFIRIGYSLFHNEFGLRLMTVLTSTAALRLLWLTLKDYNIQAEQFILVMGGIFVFHIYGFTTTPDAPLFFFTTVFFYFYQQYLKTDKWHLALILALILACLLYSKYHAILLIAFTLGAHIKLLQRKTFWLIPLITAALYIPHIYWQVSHGYPSVNYHLFERSSEIYDFSHTYLFVPGQLLMAGPLIGWLLFYFAFTIKVKDVFIRTLLVNCTATYLFFFMSTIKGNVQPHWTLIAFVPLGMLVLIRFKQMPSTPPWFTKLAIANLILITLLRLALIAGIPVVTKFRAFKNYYGYHDWAMKIKKRAGDAYVIFPGGFQEPSKYNFYTRSLKGFAYDTRYYRRTQYDLWPLEDSLQHQRALYILSKPEKPLINDALNTTAKGMLYTNWVEDTRTYQKVNIQSNNYKVAARAGQPVKFVLKITNPYPFAIAFNNINQQHKLVFDACFLQNNNTIYSQPAGQDFYNTILNPNQTTTYTFALIAPKQKGRYDLIFSLQTTPFPGGRNSRIINFTVQ